MSGQEEPSRAGRQAGRGWSQGSVGSWQMRGSVGDGRLKGRVSLRRALKAGWGIGTWCLKAWGAARGSVVAWRMDWRVDGSGEKPGPWGGRCSKSEASTFLVSEANSCWQVLKSPPFLFSNDDTITKANYHPPLLNFRKPRFGNRCSQVVPSLGCKARVKSLLVLFCTHIGYRRTSSNQWAHLCKTWPATLQSPLPASLKYTLRRSVC